MQITLPCKRPFQLSLFNKEKSVAFRHRWEGKICRHCGMTKSEVVVKACDCGCKTPIWPETETTIYKDQVFVFGHETGDLFQNVG